MNLSRLLSKIDESLTEITLVYDGGVFTIFLDDKKSQGFNDREIKSLLSKIDATALDLPASQKKDIDRIVNSVKSASTSNQLDLSGKADEIKRIRLT